MSYVVGTSTVTLCRGEDRPRGVPVAAAVYPHMSHRKVLIPSPTREYPFDGA